jgi:hypothetical protein
MKLCRMVPAQVATGGVVQVTVAQGSPTQLPEVASQPY